MPNELITKKIKPFLKEDFSKRLFENYNTYQEPAITNRRFKHTDIVPLIQALPFEKKVVGQSFEKRDIYQIKLGTGKIKLQIGRASCRERVCYAV